MFYSVLLGAHVSIAIASVIGMSIFGVQLYRKKHTKRFASAVMYSGILTTLTGVGLMFFGADITRTCVTLSAYVLGIIGLLYIAEKRAPLSA